MTFKLADKDLSLYLINILDDPNLQVVMQVLTFIDIRVHSALELSSN